MRLHELAKELDADSKRLLAIAKELGLAVKSHSSNLDKGTLGILKAAWAEELEEQAAKAAKKAKQAAAEAAEAAAAALPEPAPVEMAAAPAPAEPASAVSEAPAPIAAAGPPDAPIAAPVSAPAQPGPVEAAASAPPAPAAPASADEQAGPRQLRVTIGGHVALPADADEVRAEAISSGAATADGSEAAPEGATTETTGPTRRRGARILGRIELKPKEVAARHRGPAPDTTEYDPLDPTRPATSRRPAPGVTPRKPGEEPAEAQKPGKTKGGKPAGFEWVFDPDDNTALSAIRIGHVSGQRRPPMRRPTPGRRPLMGGSRRPRKEAEKPTHAIQVRPPIGVRELSELLGAKTREILMHFPETFDPRDKNAILGQDQLVELAIKMGREIEVLEPETEEDRLLEREQQREVELAGELSPRHPVVAVLGHVDHGKTSLLDALRKTQVAAGEAGGITQRTSAYTVRTPSGASVTFLDTPGHKAFTEMRARGAKLTDVAVLVVAADDGPMEQTIEAIDHARAADVPLLVAINKIDKPNADPRMVRQKLSGVGVMVEDWGGDVGVVEVSATKGTGLTELVERLALETEILELTADPGLPARGVVVDSHKDPERGIVATVVIKNGTLRAKDAILAGTCVGRVRFLLDDMGNRVEEAGPSMAVQVLGFEDPPEAGADLLAVEDINQARTVARLRIERQRASVAIPAAADTVTLENLFDTIAAQKVTEINVMIKADAQGTLDVLKRTVEELTHPEVKFKVIRAAVGGITEDDVLLASASKALIIGFAVTADAGAREAQARTGVEIKYYQVIYEMTEDLEKALEGELAPERRESILGHAVVREVFKISRHGSIAGCYVTDGVITRDARVRLSRDGKLLWTGRLDSLKRFKDDAKEVRENFECGLHLAGYDDIQKDDALEAFEVIEVKRTLASSTAQ
ncbi:MAG TPA: translation initiation factor IF-2 [Planctomycetota bacterium]|nr:translation initiation factor IF-2 [Planctomycetota bacterium]